MSTIGPANDTRGLGRGELGEEEGMHLAPVATPHCLRVLLIEDNSDYASLIERTLSNHTLCDFILDRAARLEPAIEKLRHNRYDAVLLDLTLPDADAETTIELVCSPLATFPIIVLTASEDTNLALLAGQAGARDFILKDRLNRGSLARKIIDVVTRHHSNHSTELAIELGADPASWAATLQATPPAFVGDDGLLADEVIFCDRLAHTIAQARANPRRFAVMTIELNHCNVLADPTQQPQALEAARHLLLNRLSATDTLARTGESTFALIVDDVRSTDFASETAQALLCCIEAPAVCDAARAQTSGLTASIGVALYPDDGRDLQSLLESAADAQRRASEAGKNEVRFARNLDFYQDSLQSDRAQR